MATTEYDPNALISAFQRLVRQLEAWAADATSTGDKRLLLREAAKCKRLIAQLWARQGRLKAKEDEFFHWCIRRLKNGLAAMREVPTASEKA